MTFLTLNLSFSNTTTRMFNAPEIVQLQQSLQYHHCLYHNSPPLHIATIETAGRNDMNATAAMTSATHTPVTSRSLDFTLCRCHNIINVCKKVVTPHYCKVLPHSLHNYKIYVHIFCPLYIHGARRREETGAEIRGRFCASSFARRICFLSFFFFRRLK